MTDWPFDHHQPLLAMLALLATDPNQDGPSTRIGGVSKRFIVSAAMLSCATVLAGYTAMPWLFDFFAPNLLEYRNVPFPLARGSVSPGEGVPYEVIRCVQDPFENRRPLPYAISAQIINADTLRRYNLPDSVTTVDPVGCQHVTQNAFSVPEGVPAGRYFIEGRGTVYGRYRAETAYFRTQEFLVMTKADDR